MVSNNEFRVIGDSKLAGVVHEFGFAFRGSCGADQCGQCAGQIVRTESGCVVLNGLLDFAGF